MNRTDIRQALSSGDQYGAYEIVDCVGYGGSSLVYRVKKGARVFILKEIYPYKLAECAKICRSIETGMVVPTEERYRKQLQLYYDLQAQELTIAEELRDSLGTNDPYILQAEPVTRNGVTSLLLETEGGAVLSELLSKRAEGGKIAGVNTLSDVLALTTRILECLAHIHAKGYLHGDVAPDNLYVSDLMQDDLTARRTIKALDYNNACHISAVKTKDFSSKKKYAPLELIVNNKRSKIGYHTDLYSVGVILVEMLNPAHKLDGGSIKQFASPYFAGETNEVIAATIALLNEALVTRIADCDAFTQKINAIGYLMSHRERLARNFIPSNSFFIGRESELEKIAQIYAGGAKIVTLKGIGGVGKTALAKQFAIRNAQRYQRIVFIPYQGSLFSTIVSDAAVCITNVTLEGCIPAVDMSSYFSSEAECRIRSKEIALEDVESYYSVKLEKLKRLVDQNTLLVIDGMDEEEAKRLKDLKTLPCHILITSSASFQGVPFIEVQPFKIEDSMRLFQNEYTQQMGEAETQLVKESIAIVSGLPLMVVLLAKLAQSTAWQLAALHQKISAVTVDAKALEASADYLQCGTDDKAIRAVLEIAFDQLLTSQDATEISHIKDILRNLSLVKYSGIRQREFCAFCKLDDTQSKNCISKLISYGFISKNDTTNYISLHPILSDFFCERLKPTEQNCAYLLEAIMPPNQNIFKTLEYERKKAIATWAYFVTKRITIEKDIAFLVRTSAVLEALPAFEQELKQYQRVRAQGSCALGEAHKSFTLSGTDIIGAISIPITEETE